MSSLSKAIFQYDRQIFHFPSMYTLLVILFGMKVGIIVHIIKLDTKISLLTNFCPIRPNSYREDDQNKTHTMDAK